MPNDAGGWWGTTRGRGGGRYRRCEQMGWVVTWRGLERRAAVEVDSAN